MWRHHGLSRTIALYALASKSLSDCIRERPLYQRFRRYHGQRVEVGPYFSKCLTRVILWNRVSEIVELYAWFALGPHCRLVAINISRERDWFAVYRSQVDNEQLIIRHRSLKLACKKIAAGNVWYPSKLMLPRFG
jgi:hypothetical protein